MTRVYSIGWEPANLGEYPKLMQSILDGDESYIKGVVKVT